MREQNWPRSDWQAFALLAGSILLALGTIAMLSRPARAESATITGTAHVSDADTLRVGHARIRLHGIDAPEAAQTCTKDGEPYACGAVAIAFARQLVQGRRVECVSDDLDRHRRIVATCWTVGKDGRREGESINVQLVRQGWAIAFTRYSTAYIKHEREAREAKRGLWSGEFELPEDVRQAARRR